MSSSLAFDSIHKLSPDFFLNLGDMHYSGTRRITEDELAFAYHE